MITISQYHRFRIRPIAGILTNQHQSLELPIVLARILLLSRWLFRRAVVLFVRAVSCSELIRLREN